MERWQSLGQQGIRLLSELPKYMLSPLFERGLRAVRFYDLHRNTILPFIEDDEKTRLRKGYHGTVWRVRIHPAHHDFYEDNNDQNPFFAVKALNPEDDNGNGFKDEVNAWAKPKGRWYLLFPWATCNLFDYWRNEPPRSNLRLVHWIAKQCLGIAEGLSKIHRSGSEDPSGQHNDRGIHGDIKPENMLLFDNSDDSLRRLVICDFGFTRFHSRETRSNANPAGYTGTYRAPEYDMKPKISRAYDMWSLGCLYLEFITWYLTGPSGVDNFSRKRAHEDHGEHYKVDKFFACHSVHDGNMLGASVKPCVLEWVRYLHTQEHCSQYLHDFLDIIIRDMLVIKKDSRQKCNTIVTRLTDIHDKCDSEGESCYFNGCPKSSNEHSVPVHNDTVLFERPVMSKEDMRSSKASSFGRLRQGNTFMVASGSSRSRPQHQAYSNIGKAFSKLPARSSSALKRHKKRLTGRDSRDVTEEDADDEQEVNEETPILTALITTCEPYHDTRDASGLTASPEEVERPANVSYFTESHIQAVNQSPADTTQNVVVDHDAEEDDISLSEAVLPNNVAVPTSIPTLANDLTGSFRRGRSLWGRLIGFMRGIKGWVGRWFNCLNNRHR